MMHVQAGRTRVDLGANGAAIERIEDVRTGQVLLDARAPDARYSRLFRVLVPSERWRSCYADSQEQPTAQVSREGQDLTLRFRGLVAADGQTTDVEATVSIEPSREPDELLFTLRIDNRSSREITEIIFPWLGGWSGLGGPGEDVLVLGGGHAFDPYSLPLAGGPPYARNRQRLRAGLCYPVELHLPWIDLSGPRGGISYLNYMPTGLNGYVSVENLAGYDSGLRLAWGWAHTVVVGPGQTWQSPPMGLAVHSGDWHETADRYRRWMNDNLSPAPGRPANRKMIGFQNVFFRGFDGEPIRDYEQIPYVAEVGRRYGVDHLCIWDHLTLGNYVSHPEHDLTDYTEEEREALSAGINQARSEGTNVSALINFRHLDPSSRRFGADSGTEVKRCYDGTAQTENFAGSGHHGRLMTPHLGPECNVYSPFSSAYRDRVLRITEDYLELGYNSMFFDQPWERLPDYSRVADGRGPDETYAAMLELLAEVRRVLHENDPNALMIGEECDSFGAQWIDLWMSWGWSDPANAERVARLRYSLPGTMLSWVIDGESDRATLAFALGMYLCLCTRGNEGTLEDKPELAEHVAALKRLRDTTADRTVMARFNDQKGLRVEGDNALRAWGYDGEEGPAVIVGAVGAPASGSIAVDREAFHSNGSPEHGVIHRLDGTSTEVSGDECCFDLTANQVGVWVL